MSDRIRLLPDSVSNQIAAGEVVNRPASAVKELIENAVDAGAKSIMVNFRDGGKELIQVVDDGCGMSPVDARLAFDRHATSKITKVEDIYALSTFGFRGEALASIAAVAEVELRTRPANDELGSVVEISGGTFKSQQMAAMPAGTQLIIRNLFFNLPARRRKIEKSTVEAGEIEKEFQRVALCHPEVAFKLYNNNALLYDLPSATLRQRIAGVSGKKKADSLLDVNASTSIVNLTGFVEQPAASIQKNTHKFFFVNGRYFSSPYFHRAVMQVYEKLIPPKTQPAYFLYLTVDAERIDVNVHPQKTEVMFDDGSAVWQIINVAIRESLGKLGVVPQMDFNIDTSVEIPVYRNEGSFKIPEVTSNPNFNPFREEEKKDLYPRYEEREVEMDSSLMEFIEGNGQEQALLEIESLSFGPLLRIGHGYVVSAFDDGLAIIHTRRAFEAVLFERYMQMHQHSGGMCQQLLFPEKLELSFEDYALTGQGRDDFTAFGFDLAFPDDGAVVEVRGVPADFTSMPVSELFFELLDVLRDKTILPGELRRTRLAAAMARSASWLHVENLSDEEITDLLTSLAGSQINRYTPGGRAVMTILSEAEIEKRLK